MLRIDSSVIIGVPKLDPILSVFKKIGLKVFYLTLLRNGVRDSNKLQSNACILSQSRVESNPDLYSLYETQYFLHGNLTSRWISTNTSSAWKPSPWQTFHRLKIPKCCTQETHSTFSYVVTYFTYNLLYTYLYKTSCFSQNSKTMPRTRKRIPLSGSIFVLFGSTEMCIAMSLSPLNGSRRQQDQFLQRRLL